MAEQPFKVGDVVRGKYLPPRGYKVGHRPLVVVNIAPYNGSRHSFDARSLDGELIPLHDNGTLAAVSIFMCAYFELDVFLTAAVRAKEREEAERHV